MRYVLNLGESAKDMPGWQEGDPVKIPLTAGQWWYDFDVIEDELPAEFVARLRAAKEKTEGEQISHLMPIGITRGIISKRKLKLEKIDD